MSAIKKRATPAAAPRATDYSNRKDGEEALFAWMRGRLAANRALADTWPAGDPRVTVLSYYFWAADPDGSKLARIECAFLETWRNCGRMKSVIVTHAATPALEKLAGNYAPLIEIQVEPSLAPGKLFSMSVDCNSRLPARFETEYLLIVQDDGFPLRAGLEAFVGKWDFIGAPYVRDKFPQQAFCKLFNCQVMNGGFSLRSRKICELAAFWWKKKYSSHRDDAWVSEDYFVTKTLPIFHSQFRRAVRLPSFAEALSFSYDAICAYEGDALPFGFHGALAFKIFSEAGLCGADIE